ncbi:MAG TPA: lipid-binding SYLF domain-containing protein [Rhodospirillaceae bacterium]|nr:lipid-binding SYLF domain-containing protein [Rhodospirillaceae bacterium]
MKSLKALFLLVLFGALVSRPAMALVDQAQTVNSATATIERMKTESSFQETLQKRLKEARAVLVVPALYKAGFIFGGQYGNGVLLARQPDGSWGYPAFYTLEGGSFGLQMGLESSAILFVVMSDAGLTALLNNQFKIGADAGITVLLVGAAVSADTTSNLGADMLAYSLSGVGLFAGISLEGAVLSPRESWNADYYGRNLSSRAIVLEGAASNPQADRLRETLAH